MKKSIFLLLLTIVFVTFRVNAQDPIFSEGFETAGLPSGWSLIDADNDGQNWFHNSLLWFDGYESAGAYASSSQQTTPDNWLVTPPIQLGSSSTLSFCRMYSFRKYDHYGVYISTTSATDTSTFTLLFEETLIGDHYQWTQRTKDLNNYDNNTVYIAFRHFNCSNQGYVILDNVVVTSTTDAAFITVEPGSLQFVDVPINTYSEGQLVTVNAFNITDAITISVNPPYEISTDNENYSSVVTMTDTEQDLYVRYVPYLVGTDSDIVSITCNTASANVLLYGNCIACEIPTDLSVNTTTSTSAIVNWTGSVSNYNLYYMAESDTDWTTIESVYAESAGYRIDSLKPSTTYTWYVAALCDEGSIVNSTQRGTFTTDCEAFTVPFEEIFDGSTNIPQCWKRYNGWASDVFSGDILYSGTSGWNFFNYYVFGAHHARLNICDSTCNKWLVSPSIDLTGISNPTLTFDLALTAYNSTSAIYTPDGQADDKFMVIISTDDGVTWSAANATVWSNDGNGDYVFNQIPPTRQEISISLTDYVDQIVRIAFYGESSIRNGDNDLHIDNVMVSDASSCATPSNLTATAISNNSVTLSWTENGTATTWNIKYGPANYQPDSDGFTVVQTNSNPFTINNLSVGTYDFYVQADCEDEPSFWSHPITATPGGYNMSSSGSDTITTCNAIIYDNGGSNGEYADHSNSTLVLFPEIPGNFITVSGSYQTENCCDMLKIYDGAGTDGTLLGEFKGTGNITNIVSSSGPLTLYFYSDNAVQNDGFELYVSCTSCTPPENLTAINIGSNSADFTWTGNSPHYKVEYKSANDMDWVSTTITDTFFSLNNLTESTAYTLKVYRPCEEQYSPAATLSFTTTMVPTAIPFSTDFSTPSEWVLNNDICQNYWTIGAVNDTANAMFITNNGITPGYKITSFSAVSAEKLFTVGQVPELEISFDALIGGEDMFDYLKVFFSRADEEYPATTTNTTYTSEGFSTNAVDFTDYLQYSSYESLPYKFNLTEGNTVHVTVVMPNPNASPNAYSTAKLVFLWKNDNNNYNEGSQPGAVIYSVSIKALSCPKPTTLNVSNITATNATITWNAGGLEEDWILEYKEDTASYWISVPINGIPSYYLNGLNEETSYQVRVQAICDDDEQSLWSSTIFSTSSDVVIDPTVSTVAATNVAQTTATLNATITNPNNVTITVKGFEWKLSDDDTYNQIAGTGTGNTFSALLSNLTLNTSYTFKAFISYYNTTVYGDEITFTTNGVSIDDHSLANSISLVPNPADNYIELHINSNVNVTEAVVYNAFGQMIQTVKITDKHTRINLSDMAVGMYFIRVNGEDMTATKKFIKR